MLQPLQFATGGYDHVVHLWEVKADLSTASPRPLAIKHSSQIQSLLAIRDTSHKLITAAADCNVHFWDLSSERVVNTVKTSNAPYHAHSTASPFCTLLEVYKFPVSHTHDDRFICCRLPIENFNLKYATTGLFQSALSSVSVTQLTMCTVVSSKVRSSADLTFRIRLK
jgi:WD40 repeat protein